MPGCPSVFAFYWGIVLVMDKHNMYIIILGSTILKTAYCVKQQYCCPSLEYHMLFCCAETAMCVLHSCWADVRKADFALPKCLRTSILFYTAHNFIVYAHFTAVAQSVRFWCTSWLPCCQTCHDLLRRSDVHIMLCTWKQHWQHSCQYIALTCMSVDCLQVLPMNWPIHWQPWFLLQMNVR